MHPRAWQRHESKNAVRNQRAEVNRTQRLYRRISKELEQDQHELSQLSTLERTPEISAWIEKIAKKHGMTSRPSLVALDDFWAPYTHRVVNIPSNLPNMDDMASEAALVADLCEQKQSAVDFSFYPIEYRITCIKAYSAMIQAWFGQMVRAVEVIPTRVFESIQPLLPKPLPLEYRPTIQPNAPALI
jgi:hypothetical protein